MCSYKIVFVTIFVVSAVSGTEKLFDPCNKDDVPCWNTAVGSFLENSYNGLSEYNIKPSDPLIIPELNVIVDPNMGLAFEFKNINVTGLKTLQVLDHKVNTDTLLATLQTKAVLNIAGDLEITLTKKNKVFNGAYTAVVTALISTQYDYSLTKKGDVEYYVMGPETNTCEITEEPIVNIDDDLQNALNNDSDARDIQSDFETNKDLLVSLWKNMLGQTVETSYITFIQNVRSATEILPKTDFFKDL